MKFLYLQPLSVFEVDTWQRDTKFPAGCGRHKNRQERINTRGYHRKNKKLAVAAYLSLWPFSDKNSTFDNIPGWVEIKLCR